MPTRTHTGNGEQDAVHAYLTAMPPAHRHLLERIQALIQQERPDAVPGISYKMLCWKIDDHRLYVGSWKHGLSIYGWSQDRELAITNRHPELQTSKGTIQLTPATAAHVIDDELRDLVRAALKD
jgi:uncharacterized protein YdhG (YjbR/CyaY superfamily)